MKLKKIISLVSILATSLSGFTAFGANFSDMNEYESYYQAVRELSTLGIVSGFDDGTFRPDDFVTRAQMAKMIVDALGEGSALEDLNSDLKFTDIQNHWARSYIYKGVSDGFISGYDDNEFGPDDNVTYVQAQKMLVSAIGYETYAQGAGGWPTGYKIWAASQGITTGMPNLADDTRLTRAQVAQLIDNTMDAPICKIKGYDTTYPGEQVPKLIIMDDYDGDGTYQSLFSEKYNVYKVFGRVVKTNKTDSSVSKDKVVFRIEKTRNFENKPIYRNKLSEYKEIDAYCGETNASELNSDYAGAIIHKDSKGEYTFLSILSLPVPEYKLSEYQTFTVDYVMRHYDEMTIYFKNDNNVAGIKRLTLYLTDDSKVYNITKDGENIDPTDIDDGDILSIAFDESNGSTMDYSSFYDIKVLR